MAYFAERPETALYEATCRREAVGVSYAMMAKRSLLSVQTTAKLSLLDLRPHASSWPVLHSLRFDQTQALAGVKCMRSLSSETCKRQVLVMTSPSSGMPLEVRARFFQLLCASLKDKSGQDQSLDSLRVELRRLTGT